MKRSETLLCRLARRSPYCPHHFPTHRRAIFHRVLYCEILALLKLYLQIGTKEKRKRRGQIYRRERNTIFAQLSFVLSLIRQEFEQLPYRKRNSSWEHACPYVKMNDVYTSRNVRDGVELVEISIVYLLYGRRASKYYRIALAVSICTDDVPYGISKYFLLSVIIIVIIWTLKVNELYCEI